MRALVACGWLRAGDAEHPGLRVETLSRSHTVYRVTAPDGKSAVVKAAGREAWTRGRSLQSELYVYRLAAWLPRLAAVLPPVLLVDEARQLLVLEFVPSAANRFTGEVGSPQDASVVGARLGSAVAAWHSATVGLALLPASAEGVLYLPDALDHAASERPASTRAFMTSIVAHPQVASGLREGQSLYRHRCLVHGDLKADNWRVDAGPPTGGRPGVTVLDWELSGAGDPAWDVASICAEAILERIRAGGQVAQGPGGWPAAVETTVRAFLRSYVVAGGVVGAADASAWQRVVLFAAARLLHVGCEWADFQEHTGRDPIDATLRHAAGLLGARAEAAEALARWARP